MQAVCGSHDYPIQLNPATFVTLTVRWPALRQLQNTCANMAYSGRNKGRNDR
jgi:hypothetical protein